MDDETYMDFLSALGEEFCEALSPPADPDLIDPHDGYEVWLGAFDSRPTPESLAAVTDDEVERLRVECVEWLECDEISEENVRRFIAGTLARWPAK